MKNLCALIFVGFALSAQAQITSTFDTDADGWILRNDNDNVTATVIHTSTGGNPGGFISGTLGYDNYPGFFWYAPTKFLGNLMYRSYGQTLSFSQQQAVVGDINEYNGNYYEGFHADIMIASGNNIIYYHLPKPAITPAWSTYTITLDTSSPWRTSASASSALATINQIKAALINVTEFAIRGNYNNTANTVSLDHVSIGQRSLTTPLTISTISQLSGKPGSSITISGSNFGAGIADNNVYFGGVAATVTSASATSLTVTVPVGALYDQITIINKTTGVSIRSAQPFNPTFEGGGRIIPASFKPKVDFLLGTTAGNDVNGIRAADLDGDGWNDLIVTEQTPTSVSIFQNLGTSGAVSTAAFSSKIVLTGGGASGGLFIDDLDGDGKQDIVAVNNSTFATFRNTSTPGNITFETVETWSMANTGFLSNVADIDGDGRPELIGQHGNGSVAVDFWIVQNISLSGDIEFGPSVSYFGGGTLDAGNGVSVGDLDDDGKPELLVSHGFGDRFSILQNNSVPGTIALTNLGTIVTGQYNLGLSISDFNLDGKNDIVWKRSSNIYIRLNTNSGAALVPTDFDTEIILTGDLSTYGGMSIGDINGDGKPDIVASDNADAGVFENAYAGGVFDAKAFIPAYQHQGNGNSTYPTSPVVADLNNDNKPELLLGVTNTSPVRISIFENINIHAPVISVNTVSPLKGIIGSTVTITGNNFSLIPSENKVFFGGVEATVLTSTANLITAEVPAGGNNGLVSVTKDGLTSRYRLPFQTTFGPGATFDNTHFAPPVNFTLTGANYNLDIGDLNRDGMPDIIAGGTASNTYAFRNSHTTGAIVNTSLVPDDTIASSTYPRLEDLDGDGYLDVMSVNGTLRKNNSTLTELSFLPQVIVPLGASVLDFADFNNDGKTDMTLTTDLSGAGDLLILENRTLSVPGNFVSGTYGSFSQNFVYNKPSADGATITGDFDGDGFADIVTTNPTTDNISIYRNLGVLKISTAQFATRVDVAVGDNPNRIYKGDFDSDGKLDLLLYHWTGTSTTLLIVLQNTSMVGSISFSRIDLTNPNAVTVAHIADLDGDGKPEILTTAEANNRFSIFKNLHTSGALTPASFGAPFNTTVTAPRAITTADINLDGKPEIVLTRAAGLLVVYENLISSGPSITISAQPTFTYACEGSTATLTVDAAGTTNITYRWQKFNGTIFTDLNEGSGYTGTTTKTLSINTATTGLAANGQYRCRINGDLATEVFSNSAQFTINSLPSPPIAAGGSKCISPSTVTLTATGTSDGNYNWYSLPTGGSVLGVNGTFTTPSITATTTYYVSIEDTFCESTRAPVVATIALLSKPTLTSSLPLVNGSINICDGETFTLNAPNGFALYTWSNGTTTQQTSITTSGTYSLIVQDAGGCTSPPSDAIAVTINPYPTANITANATELIASTGDSYQWYQNGVPVDGATNQSFEFNILEYGKYQVDVTDNGCTSTSVEFEYLITDVENWNNGIKIYPNPVEKILTAEYLPPYTISIINMSGVIVGKMSSSTHNASIDLSSFATGIYILQLKNEKSISYHRITKN
jgi:hypothetical protein